MYQIQKQNFLDQEVNNFLRNLDKNKGQNNHQVFKNLMNQHEQQVVSKNFGVPCPSQHLPDFGKDHTKSNLKSQIASQLGFFNLSETKRHVPVQQMEQIYLNASSKNRQTPNRSHTQTQSHLIQSPLNKTVQFTEKSSTHNLSGISQKDSLPAFKTKKPPLRPGLPPMPYKRMPQKRKMSIPESTATKFFLKHKQQKNPNIYPYPYEDLSQYSPDKKFYSQIQSQKSMQPIHEYEDNYMGYLREPTLQQELIEEPGKVYLKKPVQLQTGEYYPHYGIGNMNLTVKREQNFLGALENLGGIEKTLPNMIKDGLFTDHIPQHAKLNQNLQEEDNVIYRRHITHKEIAEDFLDEETREKKIMEHTCRVYGIQMNDKIKEITDSFNYKPIHEGEEVHIEQVKRLTRTKSLFISQQCRNEKNKILQCLNKRSDDLEKAYEMSVAEEIYQEKKRKRKAKQKAKTTSKKHKIFKRRNDCVCSMLYRE